MLLAAVLALNPIGLDVISAAFLSGEALSRNIWGPIALTGMAIAALVIVLDWRNSIHRKSPCTRHQDLS
jgi:hypothetical protein